MISKTIQEGYIKALKEEGVIDEINDKIQVFSLAKNYFQCIQENPVSTYNDCGSCIVCFLCISILLVEALVFFYYLFHLIPLFVAIYCILKIKNALIFVLSVVDQILSFLTYLGARGHFVSCCCLYHPSNWILFLVIIDVASIFLDLELVVISVEKVKGHEYDGLIFLAIHAIIVIYNLVLQMNFYCALKAIYKQLREETAEIFKQCVEELIKQEGN